ncbi:hypothetical protein OSH10_15000 [Kaistia defluvii]|uniref:hypothetical protein n=1 Tax=Kaistia defluvii TaxID=410841 RepID=UPI00224D39C6|nr:hypothetical protein [Kaistia defluvii]MCX5519749.1 hypothetical protein [Kaistia defluvii]
MRPHSLRWGDEISGRLGAQSSERGSWLDLIPAGLLLVASAIAIFLSTLTADAGSQEVAVVAPLWSNAAETAGIVARAGGSIVASAGLSNVIIAHSDNPDFISTLYRSGAWLVLDAVKLRGCFSL